MLRAGDIIPRAVSGPAALAIAAVLALGAGPARPAWQSPLADPHTGAGTLWDYSEARGPAHWGELAPDYQACGNGDLQSPIALDAVAAAFIPCEPLRFRYRSSSLYIKNQGVGLRLGYDRGSYLVIEGLSYELVEVRFHVPGEHVIDGHVGDAEMQLIHGNNRGDIAIIAVPIKAGHRVNQTLRRILEHAPDDAGEQFFGRNVGINALFMLPGRKDYYAYPGSLTSPPCTVMRDPLG